jgi:hypothetical protein
MLLDEEVSGAYEVSCGCSPFADDPLVKWRHDAFVVTNPAEWMASPL